MRILVIDDEAGKRQQVVQHLRQVPDVLEVHEAMSFQSAIEALKVGSFDCVVLDMRLTTYDVSPGDDGGRPRNFGGEEILRKMRRRRIETPVVVLTQYSIFREGVHVLSLEQLSMRLSSRYPFFIALTMFKHSDDSWKTELTATLQRLK